MKRRGVDNKKGIKKENNKYIYKNKYKYKLKSFKI